jgi:hypothetical protein
LIVAGALAFSLSDPLRLQAQPPRRGAETSPTAGDQATGRSRDSGNLRSRWRAQQIATRKAEAAYSNAKLTREIAEITLSEYEEGIFVQDLAALEGEIKLAESNLSLAEERLDWARKMFDKGFVSQATKISEELSLKRDVFALEQVVTKKNVLVDYTKKKTIKQLKSEIELSRANELARKAAWEREKADESALERQVRQSRGTKAKPESR